MLICLFCRVMFVTTVHGVARISSILPCFQVRQCSCHPGDKQAYSYSPEIIAVQHNAGWINYDENHKFQLYDQKESFACRHVLGRHFFTFFSCFHE